MKKFNNSEYEKTINCLIGDVFYIDNLSITSKISIIRRYAEILLRKIFDIPENEYMTIGGKNVKAEKERRNCELLTNAINNLHKYGDDNTHTEKTVLPNKQDLESVENSLFDLYAYLFIDYFNRYKFGTDSRVMEVFSILPPIIRYKTLNELYKTDNENIAIIDKLALAILKAKSKEEVLDWLEKHKEKLENLNVATKEADDDLIQKMGKAFAEIVFKNRPQNMYVLCLDKINSVSEQIEKNGYLYNTFEEAKKLYEEKGYIFGDSEDVQEFNSIMQFCYLGRRIEKEDYPNLNKFITGSFQNISV